jgi:hypothetical protein
MTHVIQSHPAVDYVQGNGVYSTGDYFALPFETARYGTMYHKFRCGTIAGLAAQDGEDVDAAIAECKQKMVDFPYMGHKMAWANGTGSSITAEARAKVVVPAQAWDDVIELDGVRYTLVPAANQNVDLVEVV